MTSPYFLDDANVTRFYLFKCILVSSNCIFLFFFKEDDVDGEKKEEIQANGPPQVEIPINISEEMTKSSLWKSFVKDGAVSNRPKNDRHHNSSRSKHRHKHGKHRSKHRDKDKDQGLWFSSDKKRYYDDDNDVCELRRLTAIEEDPVVDPKENADVPEVVISMPSTNGLDSNKTA